MLYTDNIILYALYALYASHGLETCIVIILKYVNDHYNTSQKFMEEAMQYH